jgi:hypothetical protein
MSTLAWVLIGIGVWAVLFVGVAVFMHACAVGRRRAEGGRPEDRL